MISSVVGKSKFRRLNLEKEDKFILPEKILMKQQSPTMSYNMSAITLGRLTEEPAFDDAVPAMSSCPISPSKRGHGFSDEALALV